MGIIFTVILVGIAIVFVVGIVFYLQGPPYVPSDDESTQIIVALAKKYKPNRILEMGSGKGKLVLALAEAGCNVDGIELNPWIARQSRKLLGKYPHAKIYIGDFWKFDVSSYDMITIYTAMPFMPRLQKKLTKELKKGSIIISNFASFPDLKPIEKKSRILVYKIP